MNLKTRFGFIALFAVLASVAMSIFAACTDGEPASPAISDGGTVPIINPPVVADASTDEAAAPPVLEDAGPFGICPGGYSGSCAIVQMPLDPKNPTGKTIPILINRIASVPNAKRQVWLLQGGPGGTAAEMIGIGNLILARQDDTEIFALEHRGVGASSRLGCPTNELIPPPKPSFLLDGGAEGGANAEAGTSEPDIKLANACIEEGKTTNAADLAFYTTTNAARDLAQAIAFTRRPNVAVFVYGVSYGTYWAHRFLQIEPTGADGVILDSIVTPGEQFLSKFDEQADLVVMKLAELCKLDATCTANLGADPFAKVQAAKVKLDNGHCPEVGIRPIDRRLLRNFIQQRQLSPYALAVWNRFDRCSPADVAALKRFATRGIIFTSPTEALNSDILGTNIAFSELWETPAPSQATLDARFNNAVFPANIAFQGSAYATWPKYPADEHVGKFATTSVPLLMLAGTLDAQTPIELQDKFKTHFTAANQTYVSVPTANHAVINQSPIPGANLGDPPSQCGLELTLQFMIDPKKALDTSCSTKLLPIDFTPVSEETMFFLGTNDLWVGAPVPEADNVPPPAWWKPITRPF